MNSPSESDEELILKVQQGSEESFRALYDRYKGKIYNFVYHFFGNQSAAEDCTQEIFIRLYRKSSRYSPTAKFSSWLYQMAKNIAIDTLRKNKLRRAESIDAPFGIGDEETSALGNLLSDPAFDPAKAAQSEEVAGLIRRGIAQLKDSDKQIVLLCDIEGLPHEEAAKILGYATQTLTVKLHRARQRLAEILKIEGLFKGDIDAGS